VERWPRRKFGVSKDGSQF